MGSAWDGLALILYLGLCAAGGWLLVRAGFRVSDGDRPLVGAALGVALSTWLANLLGRWMDPPLAFWMAAVTLAAAGALTWRGRHQHEPGRRVDGRSFLLLAVVLGLTILFFRIGRGLAIFDDRKNLSLIPLMA